jgi:DNA repair photolyase
MSDPYNPLEEELKLTRNALELINAYEFGAGVVTKSALAARDADVLRDIAEHSPVIIMFTITAADDGLCGRLEPNVSVTSDRFSAMKTLSGNGIYCGVLLLPVMPYITDSEENIIKIVRMAKEAGAKFVYTYMGMTLRNGNREYFYEQLKRGFEKDFNGVTEKYVKKYGYKYNISPPNSKRLWEVFTAECERLGLLYNMRPIIRGYKAGYENRQIKLF